MGHSVLSITKLPFLVLKSKCYCRKNVRFWKLICNLWKKKYICVNINFCLVGCQTKDQTCFYITVEKLVSCYHIPSLLIQFQVFQEICRIYSKILPHSLVKHVFLSEIKLPCDSYSHSDTVIQPFYSRLRPFGFRYPHIFTHLSYRQKSWAEFFALNIFMPDCEIYYGQLWP